MSPSSPPSPITTTPKRRRRTSLGDFNQLLGLDGVVPLTSGDIPEGSEAVLYLRVSTARQMNTAIDIDEDGNSIATQREVGTKRCRRLNAPIAREFVEPGNSAQSIAKRPVFRELLRYVEATPQIGYVVIYMRSRAFRNYTDAAIAKRVLAAMGVKLISAKEEFGEGYMADAMEAITDIMNEVQVRQSGEDISNKMHHKAQNGGTTGRAKLGYLNVRKDFDGRLVNTIDIDPERAPLIRWAFEQYATGEYSLTALTDALEQQGLTTRQTSRWPQRPLSRSQLAAILRDPYYIGKVTFKGEIYPGRHEALISPELFERVQRVLDVRQQRNQRDCRHSHFLRGLMQCGRCYEAGRNSQLIYSRPVNRAGRVYEYYTCTNRAGCGLPHLPVVEIEDALAREVAALRIPVEEVAALRQRVVDSLEHQQAAEQETRRRLKKELGRLDVKEERLLDLAADGGLVGKKLRKRLRDLQTRRAVLRQQLECTDEQLRREADTVLAYLDLLADPGRFYELASPVVKRKLLTAFYAQIWLDDDQHTLQPVAEPREIVTRLHQAARHAVGGVQGSCPAARTVSHHVEGGSLRSRSNVKLAKEGENMADGVSPVEAAVGSGDVSLTPVTSAKTPPEWNSEGACSNKMSVVGTTGLEPAISCSQSRRASHYATSRVPRRGDPRSLLQALAGAQRGTPQVFSVPKAPPSRELTTLMTMLPHSAGQNPSMKKPMPNFCATQAVSSSMAALITSRNRPKVSNTRQKDSAWVNGLTTAFTTPMMAATPSRIRTYC